MINFTLPNFYFNFIVNQTFFDLKENFPFYFKNKDINFSYNEGNFSYCYWNGGKINNLGKGSLYKDFYKFYSYSRRPYRLNCSNIFLEEKDFDNVMGNLILSLFQNGTNVMEITNLDFYKYIQEKYPNYDFIFSKNGALIQDYNLKLINDLIQVDKFILISLPEHLNSDLKLLNEIENKRKIEITINPKCSLLCKNYQQCLINNNSFQYNFSEKNIFDLCENQIKNYQKNYLSLDILEKDYISKGFSNFYIEDTFSNIIDYAVFMIKYFIKTEYQSELLGEITKSIEAGKL